MLPPLRSESRMGFQENRQKRNRKIPLPHGAASCDSKSPSTTETDSRSTPYEFFTGDSQALGHPSVGGLSEKAVGPAHDAGPTLAASDFRYSVRDGQRL
jgi:hypothetical protein